MRAFLCLSLTIILLLLTGCTEGDKITNEGDTNNYTIIGDTTHWGTGSIRMISPAPGSIQLLLHRWADYPNPAPHQCPHYYFADSTFTASVFANVPGGVHAAAVYVRTNPNSSFSANNLAVNVSADTFDVPVFRWQTSAGQFEEDTLRWQFFVQVTAGDGSLWLGPVTAFNIARIITPGPAVPPDAPDLDTLYLSGGSYNYVRVTWCQSTPNVDKTFIYHQSAFDGIIHIDSTAHASESYWELHDLLPATDYAVWVRAQNEFGVSAPSDTLTIETAVPAPPTELTASIVYPTPLKVHLQWRNNTNCDSLFVARRETAGAWAIIHSEAGPASYYYDGQYIDTTVTAGTTYDYRVGVGFLTGTWWSADSVHIAIP